MTQVTKSTMIGELLQIDENIAPILLNIGMHCLVKEINDFLAKDLA